MIDDPFQRIIFALTDDELSHFRQFGYQANSLLFLKPASISKQRYELEIKDSAKRKPCVVKNMKR